MSASRLAVLRWLYYRKRMPDWLRRRVKAAYFDAWVEEMGKGRSA